MAPGEPVPHLTSAERLASYPPGDTLTKSAGPAWREVQMSVPVMAPFSSLKPNLVAMIASLRIGASAAPTGCSLT